ncbi:hypothetical protein [Rhizobium sp. NRK18]|jgi:hypothetical protein|uniref:hypothetical protein n=1 Tax=Rhizobium sp. NRK18 TaxID=2964667 RepID=UPI0021C33F1A|nr:hypothetical protein [Rhizobium sp. NRK18]MCQ2003827.1 hypothetical protein [Rhizobium sp. NRK18]
MKKLIAATVLIAAAGASSAFALEPIKGSLNYGNSDEVHLTKAPAGSVFTHEFYDQQGNQVEELYKVQQGGSVELVNRTTLNDK